MNTSYLGHVDGLRAVAVLAVVLYHLNPAWLPGGFVGVDVFFVISGFVVTGSLTPHSRESWGRFIVGFYHRRLTRIVPALWVVLACTTVAYLLLIPRSWLSGQTQTVASLAFVGASNWALASQADAYFAPRAEFNPFTHTWSLGVEEQFYLLAPWLVFAGLRLGSHVLVLAALLTVSSLVLAIIWTTSSPLQAFYAVWPRFWELAAGGLWYSLLWQQPRAWPALDKLRGVAGPIGLVLLAEVMLRASPQAFPMPWALGAVIGTLLLIGLPGAAPQATTQALGTRALVWVGLRSYSLYLWHWPIFALMRWTTGLDSGWTRAAGFGLAVVAAMASFRWVEQPIRRSARWHRWPHGLTSSALVLLSVAGAFGTAAAFQQHATWSLSTVMRNSSDWYADHADWTLQRVSTCLTGPHYRALPDITVIEHRPCGTGTSDARQRLFVLGDSHATGYLAMLHRLAVDEKLAVVVYQIPGCPFLDLRAPLGEGRDEGCLNGSRAALADVQGLARPGDSVFLPSLRLNRFVDQWGAFDYAKVIEAQLGALADQGRARALADAKRWVEPLEKLQLPIIIEAPKPIFRAPPFRCADTWTRINPLCAAGLVENRADEEAYRLPVLRTVEQFARDTAHTTVFDPLPALCGPDRCSALADDGRPLFFDADHLSRYGNERVYPAFHAHWRQVTAATQGPR